MTGPDAISWGYNPSFGADPYYQQYIRWSQALDKKITSDVATQSEETAQGSTTSTGINTPAFKGNAPQQTEKSHTFGKILLFTGSAAAILAGVAANKGGGIIKAFENKGFVDGIKQLGNNTKDGFSNIWTSIKGKIPKQT